MKSLIVSLISLSALLLAASAQLSTLSPSYSFQGTIVFPSDGVQAYPISVSVDTARGLEVIYYIQPDTTEFFTLSSGNDAATYISENNSVCAETAFDDRFTPFPLNTNVWNLYAAGTESPAGTFNYSSGFLEHQVVIVNGIPATFTFKAGNRVTSQITVSNFDNTTPDFSVFSLPSECSQFSCSACYQGPPFPTLSSSYSLQGALARAEDGVVTLTVDYSVSVDISRGLQFVDETVTIAGVVSNNIRLSTESEGTTYISVNGLCSEVAFNPNVIFPLDTNVWDLYAAGTESPLGTYTFTQGGISYEVTIVDRTPVAFAFSFGNTVITLIVSNFDNTTPDFSTFSLPSECSQFSCTACYSSAVSASISILLLLTTLLMYLLTTL